MQKCFGYITRIFFLFFPFDPHTRTTACIQLILRFWRILQYHNKLHPTIKLKFYVYFYYLFLSPWIHILICHYVSWLNIVQFKKCYATVTPFYAPRIHCTPISRNCKGDKHHYFCRNAGLIVTPGRSSTKYLSLGATSALDRITRMHFSRAIERANTSPEWNLLKFPTNIETSSSEEVHESFNSDEIVVEKRIRGRLCSTI